MVGFGIGVVEQRVWNWMLNLLAPSSLSLELGSDDVNLIEMVEFARKFMASIAAADSWEQLQLESEISLVT